MCQLGDGQCVRACSGRRGGGGMARGARRGGHPSCHVAPSGSRQGGPLLPWTRQAASPRASPGASCRVQFSTGAGGRVTSTLSCPFKSNCVKGRCGEGGAGGWASRSSEEQRRSAPPMVPSQLPLRMARRPTDCTALTQVPAGQRSPLSSHLPGAPREGHPGHQQRRLGLVRRRKRGQAAVDDNRDVAAREREGH